MRFPFVVLLMTAVALPLGIAIRAARSPAIVLIDDAVGAPWISYPYPATTSAIPGDARLAIVFRHDLDVTDLSSPWTLRARALRELAVTVNGRPVPTPPRSAADWRRVVAVELGDDLLIGRNTVEVTVRNPNGPALLQAAVVGPGATLATGSGWSVGVAGREAVAAVVASDTRPYVDPDAATLPTPATGLARRWPVVVGLFTVAAALLTLARRRGVYLSDRALAIAVSVAWLYLFLVKMWPLDMETGFDIRGHLGYIDALVRDLRVPLAGDGRSSYHPPLFYAVAAVVRSTLGTVLGERSVRIVPFLSGLGNVALAFLLARAFLGDRRRRAVVYATSLAAVLPMGVYMSGYVSNESLSGFLVGAVLVAGALHLLAAASSVWTLVAIGLLLGLALLTKFSALALVPWLGLYLIYRERALDGRGPLASLARGALPFLVAGLVAGWYYVRNVMVFGRPLVFNWEVGDGGRLWWQAPGFHSAGYFARFGGVLRDPWFPGFRGFWDGLYGSLWGDGYLGGRASIAWRPEAWNYDFMAASYLVALPVTAVLVVGFLRLVRAARDDAVRGRRGAAGLLAVAAVVFVAAAGDYALRAPMYSAVKAFFALGLVAPLGLMAGLGGEWMAARAGGRPWLEVVLDAAWATALAIFYLAYAA